MHNFFVHVEGANIDTDTTITRELIPEVKLAGDEQLVSLDVTSLNTNVPVAEAIEIAVQKVYLKSELPPLQKEVFKRLLQLAVSNVHFKCGAKWYVQTDGLAMGASLAVILSNLCMKKFEFILSSCCPDPSQLNDTEKCSKCNHRVRNHDRGVQ